MKRFLLAGVALLALTAAQPALAADRPIYKAPPVMDPIFNWTGFYVGGNVGAAWTRADVATTNAPVAPGGIFGLPGNIAAVNAAGTGPLNHGALFTGGIQAGYNWQVSPAWLVGLEADFNSFSQTSTLANVAATTLGPFPVTTSLSTDWLATLRGRAGLTFNNGLLYVTGGAAFTKLTLAQSVNAPALAPPAAGAGSTSTTKVGWTGGAGLEYMLWDRWSVKGEYLFAHFGGLNNVTTVNTTAPPASQLLTATTNHFNVHVVRLGLSYHFK